MSYIKRFLNVLCKHFFSFVIIFSLSNNSAFAQDADTTLMDDSIVDLGIVAGTCAAGAILGLSTLPFMEEPSKHYKNIIAGGSVGIIVGVILVAWMQASKSQTRMVFNDSLLNSHSHEWSATSRLAFVDSGRENSSVSKFTLSDKVVNLGFNFDF